MSQIPGVTRERLLSVLDELEWHQQRANYQPECPLCLSWEADGHEPDCRLQRLIVDIEKGASMPKKNQYLMVVTKVAVIERIEDVDMRTILDKYREDGAAEIVSANVVELTEDEVGPALQAAVDK